jgi:hypothetical protein
VIGIPVRRAARKIGEQRVTDFLGQGQSHLIAAFARHPHDAVAPVDVVEAKSSHVARARAEPRQQQHDRAVAQPPSRRTIAYRDDARQFGL